MRHERRTVFLISKSKKRKKAQEEPAIESSYFLSIISLLINSYPRVCEPKVTKTRIEQFGSPLLAGVYRKLLGLNVDPSLTEQKANSCTVC